MQTTKKVLLSMLILGSAHIIATVNEINNEPTPGLNDYQKVGSSLMQEVFKSLTPVDGTFDSAQGAFEKFTKEKKANKVLLIAGQLFADEAEYCRAIGAYAEVQKFPFLASLFYQKATQYDSINKTDLSEHVRALGVCTVVNMLNKLNVQDGFIQNPRELFTKKDATGKSCLDQANDVFKLVGQGFKDRSEFMKAVYDYQKSIGGQSHVVQMFGDCFVHTK